jgi:hypothetical protein
MIAEPASPGAWIGAVTMLQPAPKMRSPPASAMVHVRETRHHSATRRPAATTLPITAIASVSVARRSSFRRHSSSAPWTPSTKKDAARSSVKAVPASSGALRTSSPMNRVRPALAYAQRRAAGLTRRKLCRPSSTPATISSMPTSLSDDGPERSGTATASPARTSAAVPSPSRSRVTVFGDGSAMVVLGGVRGQQPEHPAREFVKIPTSRTKGPLESSMDDILRQQRFPPLRAPVCSRQSGAASQPMGPTSYRNRGVDTETIRT